MTYPAKLCVISPHIRTISDPFSPGVQKRSVFLEAWAALLVERDAAGRFGFCQTYRHDQLGNASIELLTDLMSLLEHPTVLAAFRVNDLAGALVEVTRGAAEEVRGKGSLSFFREAMFRGPIDAALLDNQGGMPTLKRQTLACDLMAEWDKPAATYNPAWLRQQLSARSQAMWVAIAKDRLPADEAGRAMSDFANWKEQQLID